MKGSGNARVECALALRAGGSSVQQSSLAMESKQYDMPKYNPTNIRYHPILALLLWRSCTSSQSSRALASLWRLPSSHSPATQPKSAPTTHNEVRSGLASLHDAAGDCICTAAHHVRKIWILILKEDSRFAP